jgi:hypothetical protein
VRAISPPGLELAAESFGFRAASLEPAAERAAISPPALELVAESFGLRAASLEPAAESAGHQSASLGAGG